MTTKTIRTKTAMLAMSLAHAWQLQVTLRQKVASKTVCVQLQVPPPIWGTVKSEMHKSLPMFNPQATAWWAKGTHLHAVEAQECTTPNLLDAKSVQVRTGKTMAAPLLKEGEDYAVDPVWGTIGRLPNGRIKEDQAVYVTYRHGFLRIDSVVMTHGGQIRLRPGVPKVAAPLPPTIRKGERCLGNVWLPGQVSQLTSEHLFPVLETAYPEPPLKKPTPAEKLLPRAMKKLRSGKPLRILAWGDSVTVGAFLPSPARERWQAQFVTRLRKRFPKAKIQLLSEAWGGRNTEIYLSEPPGSEHNYQEKVLDIKPDLIVSEFVNDAWLNSNTFEQRYGKFRTDFKAIGAEWIILTPHYIRHDWMGLTKERDIDDDPREYVKDLRRFAREHRIALADASLRYGRLWRQGIPYNTLMLNSINHPDARGMSLFADSLMALFPKK